MNCAASIALYLRAQSIEFRTVIYIMEASEIKKAIIKLRGTHSHFLAYQISKISALTFRLRYFKVVARRFRAFPVAAC
jgi:hypothetical protein